jgi:PAS domain S-box-containing protein
MSLLPRHAAPPSNAQLSAALDGVNEVLLLLDARHRVSFCNRAAQRLLGCEPGQPVRLALDRFKPDAQAAVLAALTGNANSEPVASFGAQLADGTVLALSLGRSAGSGWVLRAAATPPHAVALPLAAAATSELIRLLWDSPQALMVQDTHFVTVAANRAFFETFGLSPDQVLGRDLAADLPPVDREEVRQCRAHWTAALLAGRQPERQVEQRLRDGRGGEHWFRCAPRWVSADGGAPLLLGLLQDITAERQVRLQAEHAAEELAHWFDLSPVGMLVYDSAGLVLRSNAAFGTLVGRIPVLLRDLPADLCQLLAWEGDAPHAELQVDALPLEVRASVTWHDGRRQRLRARLRAYRGEGGLLRVMAMVEDRSLEDEHDLAQLEIGALMDTASVGVATYEASRGWLNSRPQRGQSPIVAPGAPPGAVPHKPGLSPSSATSGLSAIGREQVQPGSRDEFERLQRALREGRRAQVRYAVSTPDLGTRWLLTRVEPGELTGGRAALSVVTLDVTEQEEAHRRSEQLLRELSTILEGTSAGIAYLRGERLLRCNRRFEAMLGLATGQVGGALLTDILADQSAAQALLRRALTEDGRHEIELSRRGPDGSTVWYALSVSRAAAGGEPELVVVLTDVSRLKAQQAELEALARDRALMFNLSDVGLAYLRDSQIERANEALAALTGYAVGELLGMHPSALFEDEAAYQQRWQQQQGALTQTGRWSGERRLRRRDGRLLWVQVSKRRVDEADAQAGLICSYVDVDERHRAREAVQLQAERTRAILDSVLVGIVTVGDGGIEWMNRSARRMFGGELADFVGEPIAIVATADLDHPLRATHYRQALGDGQAETFECRLRGRDGREFWVVGNAVVTGRSDAALSQGSGSQITFALLDIERRRQAEVSIAQAQASLQRIIDTAPLAIALFDAASGRVLRLNQMAATFFGRPVGAVLGRPPEEWFGADDAVLLRQDLDAALALPEGLRRELPRPGSLAAAPAESLSGGENPPPAEGSDTGPATDFRAWDMRIVPLDPTGEPQLLLVASDVTEQRVAEQARFDAAVSQREMLVKEVHHRIKNNLQGVAGLLQQTAARRPEVASLISEAVGQVQAIAQVHGLQVGVSGPLRIKPLIEAISASVQRTFGRTVTVLVEGTPPHRFALPEAESIPIALTINELLTNAIKHSAPGDIRIVLHCDEARLAISVHNPGQLRAGFSLAQVPPGVSGLGLVRALLPRRTATLTLVQMGVEVEARIVLVPPSITLLEPL